MSFLQKLVGLFTGREHDPAQAQVSPQQGIAAANPSKCFCNFNGQDYIIFHAYDASENGIPKLIIRNLNWRILKKAMVNCTWAIQ